MEYIETYKGIKIYKSNSFFKAGVMGADVSNINFLKKLIDIKKKKENSNK
jgi:hypothetical protein